MVETLYKTANPLAEKSERYELSLRPIPGSGNRVYAFREDHGWWDGNGKVFVHHVKTIDTSTGEGLTFDEAEGRFLQTRNHLPGNGFILRFTPDFSGEKTHEYRLLEV